MQDKIRPLKFRNNFCKASCLLFLFISCVGCIKETTEDDLKRLEAFDPQFVAVLKKKKEIDLKISSLEKQIADEKINTEAKVLLLRDEFENKRGLLRAQASEAKSLIDPEKKVIKDKIAGMNEEIRPKAERLKNIELMFRDMRSLLEKSKDTNINLQEKEKWDKQIYTLEKEKEKVTKEIGVLKEKIRLFEMELRILR